MGTEKRLIDANELVSILEEYATGIYYEDIFSLSVLKRIIGERKTVDAVEVVRCKDCTRYKKGYCTIRKDGWGATLMVGMTDYCSDGERKDNEQT